MKALPRIFASTLALAVLMFAGTAHAASHKSKKAELKLTAPTQIAGVTLQPGDYETRQIDTADGPVVEFTRVTTNYFVGDSGLSPYEYELAARVNCTLQSLTAPPHETQLVLASDGNHAVGLQIRGDNTEYVFGQ